MIEYDRDGAIQYVSAVLNLTAHECNTRALELTNITDEEEKSQQMARLRTSVLHIGAYNHALQDLLNDQPFSTLWHNDSDGEDVFDGIRVYTVTVYRETT